MAQVEAILWDIDGTLLRGGGIGRAATKMAMEQVFGLTGDLDNHQFGGKTDYLTLVELLTPHGFDQHSVGARLPEYATVLADAMTRLAPDHNLVVLPNALELLAALQSTHDIAHGLVTGNCQASAQVKLKITGFNPDTFTYGAFGDESVNRNDLPPRAIQRAVALTQRDIAPENVLIIGDTPDDVRAARANGMQVCIVATGFSKRETLAAMQPDYLLDDLKQFMDAVQL